MCDGTGSRCRSPDMVDTGVRRAYLDPDNTLAPRSSPTLPAAEEHARQHAGGGPLRSRSRRHRDVKIAARAADREQGEVRHAESVGFDRRLGAADRCRRWCRLVPGDARIGIGRHRRKGDGAGKEALMSASTSTSSQRGPANATEAMRLELYDKVNALRHRRAGPWRAVDRARRQDPHYPTHAASKPSA